MFWLKLVFGSLLVAVICYLLLVVLVVATGVVKQKNCHPVMTGIFITSCLVGMLVFCIVALMRPVL